MVGDAIVGFIDILGYKSLVEEHINNIGVIKGIENIIRKSSVELIKGIRNIPLSNLNDKEYLSKIMDTIKVRYISDTVLFTLHLSNISSTPGISMNDNISYHILVYFRSISTFCPCFIGKTGHVLQGGISIGSHYENKFDDNLFIFSKAYIDAYELQKCETARIVMDNRLISYLKDISFKYFDEFFYKDSDGSMCFNFYCIFQHDDGSKEKLSDIRKGLLANIRKNSGNDRALEKLKDFVEFHNKKVNKDELDFCDLVIKTDF